MEHNTKLDTIKMVNNLEFELNQKRKTNCFVEYEVLRKGLVVGILVLDNEPYGMDIAKKDLMVLKHSMIEAYK